MNILYLHGLFSQPNQQRIQWLQQQGHIVDAPHLHYEDHPNTFELMAQRCEITKPDLIIGFSMGGFIGFHLSRKLSIPCIVFNPALTHPAFPQKVRYDQFNDQATHIIIVGLQDDVVNAWSTIEYINNQHYQNCAIIEVSDLEHRVPFDTFQMTIEKSYLLLGHIQKRFSEIKPEQTFVYPLDRSMTKDSKELTVNRWKKVSTQSAKRIQAEDPKLIGVELTFLPEAIVWINEASQA